MYNVYDMIRDMIMLGLGIVSGNFLKFYMQIYILVHFRGGGDRLTRRLLHAGYTDKDK